MRTRLWFWLFWHRRSVRAFLRRCRANGLNFTVEERRFWSWPQSKFVLIGDADDLVAVRIALRLWVTDVFIDQSFR